MKVLEAIRITISYPLLYEPYKMNDNYYIDGAALNDYPIIYFKNIKRKIGISLETDMSDTDKLHNITNILTYVSSIIFSILRKYNHKTKKKYKSSTITIKLPKIHALEYGISYKIKKMLRKIGYNTTKKFIYNKLDTHYTLKLKYKVFNILKYRYYKKAVNIDIKE